MGEIISSILRNAGGDALVVPLAFLFLILMFYGDRKVRGVEKTFYYELEKVRKGHSKDMNALKASMKQYTDQELKHQEQLNQRDILSLKEQMSLGFKAVTKAIESLKGDLEGWKRSGK